MLTHPHGGYAKIENRSHDMPVFRSDIFKLH
jgi:hypothetical protein